MSILNVKDNRLFTMAHKSKYRPHLCLIVLLIGIIIFLIPLIFQIFFAPLNEFLIRYSETASVLGIAVIFFISMLMSYGPTILCLFAWVKYIEKRNISTLGFTRSTKIVPQYLRGFVIGIIMISCYVITLVVLGYADPLVSLCSTTDNIVLLFLVGWILQGASEEIILRGWALPLISVRHNVFLGLLVSSLIFAILHLFNPNITVLSFVNLILFGLLAALYVIWEENLWGICALHAAWNWSEANLFGLEVSGYKMGNYALLNVKTSGPDYLTGGLFGPEGSIIETVFLISGIFILLYLNKAKNR